MNNELMKKAWDQFGGVWPTTFSAKAREEDQRIGVCTSSYTTLGIVRREKGDLATMIANEAPMHWVSVCTKQQFEAYGASLEKEWVPRVGVEYEFSCSAKGKETTWTIGNLKYISAYTCVMTGPSFTGELVAHPDTMKFRPIKTEREKFIDQAIDDYLVRVGSDAVNPKWYGRIFGAMYDERYRKNET